MAAPPRPGSPERMWDGFRWVEVEMLPEVPKRSFVTARPLTDAEMEAHEAKGRLVNLQREMAKHTARRARVDLEVRKHAEAQTVRDEKDELLGREDIRWLENMRAADEDDVNEAALKLHENLMNEATGTQSSRSRIWVRAFRELDDGGLGRVSFHQFSGMLKRKLHLRGRTRAMRTERDAALAALWRAIDDDGQGNLKGYLTQGEFITFLKRGVAARRQLLEEEAEEAKMGAWMGGAAPPPLPAPSLGWRERLAAQRKRDAASVREQRREQHAADALMANVDEFRRQMAELSPASEGEQRELSAALNRRLGADGWYGLFKGMDRSGDGRASWSEFTLMLRERVPTTDDDVLRRIWRALDKENTGSLSLSAFSAFMKLGAVCNKPPPSTYQQMGAMRQRVSAELEDNRVQADKVSRARHTEEKV